MWHWDLMGAILALIYRIIFGVVMEARGSDLVLPNYIDSKCPNYGILSPSSDELEEARFEADPTNIWVKNAEGNHTVVPAYTATEALKIYEGWEFRQFLRIYEMVCGKGLKPPFYDMIPYVKSEPLRECIRKANSSNNSRAEAECYEEANARKK